jgi:nitrite reductase (NO-forming) / hydroxylamine reductase
LKNEEKNMTHPINHPLRISAVLPLAGLFSLTALTAIADAGTDLSRGEELYANHCAACHQPDGKGIPGVIPPLAANPRVNSDKPGDIQDYLGKVIFGYHGALMVDRQLYTGRMPPIGYFGRVNDSELLDLINFQRQSWGNDARPVTAAELAEARSKSQ